MRYPRLLCMLAVLLTASIGYAELSTEPVPYSHDGVELEGYLVLPDGEPRGAVLVVHEWWGHNEYAQMRSRMLAELGYVAFAVDMYGKGKVTEDPTQAGIWAGEVTRDRMAYRARVLAGVDAFKATGHTDGLKIGAIGYCFGGTTVTELAYAGADVAGVVAFHGNPKPPLETDEIEATILLCHGDEDTLVPDETLKTTTDALDAKEADWILIRYSGGQHAFSNPKADGYGIPGVGYDAKADKRAWSHMRVFFDELLANE